MKQPDLLITKTALGIMLTLGFTSIAHASGFRIPEISAVGTGTANALVANTSEIGALAYNPAAMSFHSGKALSAGLTHVGYDLDVTTTNGNFSTVGEDSFLIPNLYFMAQGHDRLSFGLAINAPFGLETAWPDETFPAFAGGADGLEPALSKIEMVNMNPNLAYKIDDSSSVSFGVNYYHLRKLVFNSQAASINGAGSGFGLRLGYMKKSGNLNIGLSYSTSVDIDLRGATDLSAFAVPAMAGQANVELPSLLQVGASYQVSDNLLVEFDIEHTGWSSFDKISITNSSGTELTSSTNNWKDVTAYRLGVIYQLNDKTKLLFGYADDPTPQELEHFSARIPDSDRNLYSIGFTRDIGNNMVFEGSYMLVDFDGRNINSGTAYTGSEPNGTTAYNGEYDSGVNLLSVGVSMKF